MTLRTHAATTERDTAPGAPALRASPLLRLDLLLMLLLFALAIVPRAAWVAYNDRPPRGLNDPTLYALFGDTIADGGGYVRPTGEKFAYYPVGYPATLGALKKAGDIFGWDRSTFSMKMMNGMFGAITVVLIYLLASRIFDRRVGLVAGGLLAVFPSQVYYNGTVLSEPLFTLMWVGALLVLLWDPWSRDGMPWYRLFAAGLLLSAATMTRGVTLMFPAVLLLLWLFCLRSRKRALVQALIVWAGIAVLVVPWSVRNSLAFGQLTGPSTNLGDDLCIGNFLGAQGAFTLQGKCFAGFQGQTPQQVELGRNKEGVRIAVHDVVTHPLRMPKLIAQKAYWLLYKDDDGLWAAESYGNDYFIPAFRREVLAFAANAIYYAAGALAIAGALAFVLARDIRRLAVMAALLYILAIPLVFFGDPRFHFPAIPLVVVVAAATIVALWDRRARRLPAMDRIDVRAG
ncbi:MAG TPA: glycosyltransferase family 39 protein [Dehalococcoidia bacterium]|nr:glycosyltransferase family 39 protein [Dehalococcoidia bacterium]